MSLLPPLPPPGYCMTGGPKKNYHTLAILSETDKKHDGRVYVSDFSLLSLVKIVLRIQTLDPKKFLP